MSRPKPMTLVAAAALLVALVGGWLWWSERQQAETTARSQAARARAQERERERRERWERVGRDSRRRMPERLEGVELGMTMGRARRARPAMAPNPAGGAPSEPGLVALEERLDNGARAVFLFERQSERLQRVQILSTLPGGEAIAPHLAAMNDRYGPPTGVWDCPDTGGVPTRRFTWRGENVTVSDVFLIVGGRVSVTFYLAPTDVTAASLRRSSCRPVSRDQLDRFPVADPRQVLGGQGAQVSSPR